MNVLHVLHLRARGISLPGDERETLERRIVFAVDRFADRIRRLDVTFEDVNGPRGGVDVKCHVHLTLRDGADIDVESLGPSPLASGSTALDRLRRTVGRKTAKRVEERRSSPSLRAIVREAAAEAEAPVALAAG
jgi:putative sigma-54 modulation protein